MFFLVLCGLSALVNIVCAQNSIPQEHLLGDWEVTEVHDLNAQTVRKLRSALYFQFTNAHVCIVTNTAERRRVNWSWDLQGDELTLIQMDSNQRKIGRIAFFKNKEGRILRKFQYTYTYFYKQKLKSGKIKTMQSGPFMIIVEA